MEKYIKLKFRIPLILSILGVIAIPGIVLSAIYINKYPLLLISLIISIAIDLFDFYGLPFFWISYSNVLKMKRLYNSIVYENIYSVEDLSKYCGYQKASVIENLNSLMKKGYLKGYLFDGQKVTLNEFTSLKKKIYLKCCPYCGGKELHLMDDQNMVVCDYCKSKIPNIKPEGEKE